MIKRQQQLRHCDYSQPEAVKFIDHRTVEWERVKRTRYFAFQRFHYAYPGPIRDLRQNLVVVPVQRYGDQRLEDCRLVVTPYAVAPRPITDSFGNRVYAFDVPHVEQSIAFEISATVERSATLHAPPCLSDADALHFTQPTRLTTSDERIRAIAQELRARFHNPASLAEAISEWVSGAFCYSSGATAVTTTAAEALAIGRGLCQDYAHVMIAICRAAGLPARYVSGHMLGEGGSHAWVQALVPSGKAGKWRGIDFDPTNRRKPNLGYTTVAFGRDYADVAPTSGSFTAPYGGKLSFSKRAGLTAVEYTDGAIVQAG